MTNLNIADNIDLIKYPLITDKTIQLLNNNQYTFIVDPKISKNKIKQTLEYIFNIKIIKVNTCQIPRKKRRVGRFLGIKPNYKKAIVKLSKNYTINLFSQN
jgi:large subunit ribosomal protein L23|uniref:Large ribosomal subunit protein uL23c n=1 Tax=Vaucheria litorea TaxID=109269 RepID=B7T1Y2_VAULI|nr:ribosomal protein L23 [Vaucheria litorea]ACF70948.1 ribosomal protein L23 [Vaucheria litorea]